MTPLLFAFVAISILAIQETSAYYPNRSNLSVRIHGKSSTLLREILGSNRQRRGMDWSAE